MKNPGIGDSTQSQPEQMTCQPALFSDDEWGQLINVIFRQACTLTNHDKQAAGDLTDDVIVRLLETNPTIGVGRVDAYVRTMTRNLFAEQHRRANAAYRAGGAVLLDPSDLAELTVTNFFQQRKYATSPSERLIRQEMRMQIESAYRAMIAQLPKRKSELLRLATEGKSHQEIANKLGYASASVVKTTLSRLYRELRTRFQHEYADLWHSMGSAA